MTNTIRSQPPLRPQPVSRETKGPPLNSKSTGGLKPQDTYQTTAGTGGPSPANQLELQNTSTTGSSSTSQLSSILNPTVERNPGASLHVKPGDPAPTLDDIKQCLGSRYSAQDAEDLYDKLVPFNGKNSDPVTTTDQIGEAISGLLNKTGNNSSEELIRLSNNIGNSFLNAAGTH